MVCMLSETQYGRVLEKGRAVELEVRRLEHTGTPPSPELDRLLEERGEPQVRNGAKLADLLRRKVRTTRAATPYELKNKLIRYGLAQGYDYEAVRDAADALIATTDDSCDTFF